MSTARFIRTSIIGVALVAQLLIVPSVLLAQNIPQEFIDGTCTGATGDAGGCTGPEGREGIDNIRDSAINIISFAVSVAAVVVLILGGLRFITANGDPQAIATARTTIIYAIVGLVVALAAQAITQLVFSEV